MNPKSVNDLDPKLKEAYERIMGTNFTPDTSQAKPQAEEKKAELPTQPLMQTQPVFNQPTSEAPAQAPINDAKSSVEISAKTLDTTPTVFTQSPSSSTDSEKKPNKLKPVLIVLGIIIFIIVYAVISYFVIKALNL